MYIPHRDASTRVCADIGCHWMSKDPLMPLKAFLSLFLIFGHVRHAFYQRRLFSGWLLPKKDTRAAQEVFHYSKSFHVTKDRTGGALLRETKGWWYRMTHQIPMGNGPNLAHLRPSRNLIDFIAEFWGIAKINRASVKELQNPRCPSVWNTALPML